MSKKESWLLLLIDSSYGVYIPQLFSQLTVWGGISDEDRAILREGPSHEDYWEVWEEVLDAAQASIDGKVYRLYQDGDLWAYREPEDEQERKEYQEFFETGESP